MGRESTMGHYKKKPYKKKSMDLYHNHESIDDYIAEINSDNEHKDLFEEETIISDEINILNEPEIVKELRQEERLGKLPVLLFDLLYGEPKTTLNKNIQEVALQETRIPDNNIYKNYDETLLLAKKALQNVSRNNNIIYLDEE